MFLFHSRFSRRDCRHPWKAGRHAGFWHAAFHHGRGRHDDAHDAGHAHAGRSERLQARAAAFLDLDDAQVELMGRLFEQLHAARRAAKAVARGPEVAALVATENFKRDEAQALFDRTVDGLKASGPALIAAFGDFFDALDFEQQQMLRFVLSRRRHRGAGRGKDDASWAA